MKNRIIDYAEKSIASLETRKKYTIKEAEELKTRITKLVSVEPNISEEDIKSINLKLENLIAKADNTIDDSKLISKVSPRTIKVPKKVAVAVASFATIGAVTVGGFTLTGCGENNSNKETEQEIDIDALKSELKDEVMKEIEAEQISEVQATEVEEKEKVISENLSFDPNNNDELVSRMADFIEDSWSNGIDVPVDKMMDYYMVMNLEDIDPIDYARLNYSNKTTEDILTNYQYCANLYMDDLLTIKNDTTVDYSIIVADKDSAESLNTLELKIASMNSKDITSKDVHDYIYNTYIDGKGQREFLYNVGPNFQAYNFMFSYDELTNGLGLSKAENDILNEDRIALCSTEVVEGEKNKSDKAQEQTSIVNQLQEKLDFARDYYDQDLTNVSESEKKTGIELENEITALLKERNATLIENPEYTGSYSNGYSSKSSSSKSNGSYGGGSAGGEGGNTTYTKLTPEQEAAIRNNYNATTSYTDAAGNPTNDIEKTKRDAEAAAKKQAEDDAKEKAKNQGTTTKFVPVDDNNVDQTVTVEEQDYTDSEIEIAPPKNISQEGPIVPSQIEDNNNDSSIEETVEYEYIDYTTVDTPNVSISSSNEAEASTDNSDLLSELYEYRDELLNMQSYYEAEEMKTK